MMMVDKPEDGSISVESLSIVPQRYHAVIEVPVCAKCSTDMKALVLKTDANENIPVLFCRPCQRIHKVAQSEMLDWMCITKLTNVYFGNVRGEGKLYEV